MTRYVVYIKLSLISLLSLFLSPFEMWKKYKNACVIASLCWSVFYLPSSYYFLLSLYTVIVVVLIKFLEKNKKKQKTCAVSAAMKMTEENRSEVADITMDDVKILIKRKDDIEEQIRAYFDVLGDVSLSDIHVDIHAVQSYTHLNSASMYPTNKVLSADLKHASILVSF